MEADALDSLPDGLHIGLCGAGSPFPDEQRSGPCTLVIAGRHMFVFDAGDASARNINRMGFNAGNIEAIFLTHFHSDHIDGLGELMLQRWGLVGNANPVPIYGPTGVEAVVAGFKQAYDKDHLYRVQHHGESILPAHGFGGEAKPFAIGYGERRVLLRDADLEIVAFAVDHAPVHPAVGYHISYKGRIVVLSGDTKKSPAVLREARGADVLVHEALSLPMVQMLQESADIAGKANLKKIFSDIVGYHTTVEQAAETARDAGAGYLLLNHIVPGFPGLPGLETAFLGGAPDIYRGPIRVGKDGDFLSLPASGGSLSVGHRF
jgi:ribonuclease Z